MKIVSWGFAVLSLSLSFSPCPSLCVTVVEQLEPNPVPFPFKAVPQQLQQYFPDFQKPKHLFGELTRGASRVMSRSMAWQERKIDLEVSIEGLSDGNFPMSLKMSESGTVTFEDFHNRVKIPRNTGTTTQELLRIESAMKNAITTSPGKDGITFHFLHGKTNGGDCEGSLPTTCVSIECPGANSSSTDAAQQTGVGVSALTSLSALVDACGPHGQNKLKITYTFKLGSDDEGA